MLLGNNQRSAYKNTQTKAKVSVSSNFELIHMLHTRLIEDVSRVGHGIANNDETLKSENLLHAMDIIEALTASLPLESAPEGDLVHNLYDIYQYAYKSLIESVNKGDSSEVDRLNSIFSDLREGWAEYDKANH
ncbi:flagellar export chaperone FliS [Vibrio sp.]|nr:flagellar export chaperone FliS [Vibrio sp.]